MGMTAALYANMLKETYEGPARNQLRKETPMYDRIRKTADNIVGVGKDAVVPLLMARPAGVGARLDGKPLPTAGQSRYEKALITIKHTYARVQWTGPAARASESNKGAFAPVKSTEMQNTIDAFMEDFNRSACQNTGVGSVAALTVNAAPGDTTINVDDTISIQEGGFYEIWTNPTVGGGTQGETIQVYRILTDTTFSIAAPGLVGTYLIANTIKLIRAGAKEAEIMGMDGLIDDGSNLVICQGVDRTAERLWRSIVHDPGVDTALDINDLRAYSDKARNAGAKKLAYYTTRTLKAAYEKLCQEQKMFMDTMKFDKGAIQEAITYDGCPIFVDSQLKAGQWLGVEESHLMWNQLMDLQWLAPAGQSVLNVSGYDMVEMILCIDSEFAIDRCNTSFSLRHRVPA